MLLGSSWEILVSVQFLLCSLRFWIFHLNIWNGSPSDRIFLIRFLERKILIWECLASPILIFLFRFMERKILIWEFFVCFIVFISVNDKEVFDLRVLGFANINIFITIFGKEIFDLRVLGRGPRRAFRHFSYFIWFKTI